MVTKSITNLEPTPLQRFCHKKGWRLVRVKEELIARGTPVSWPILVNINRGFKMVKGKKFPYHPTNRILIDIGKLFKKKAAQMYEDRSKE